MVSQRASEGTGLMGTVTQATLEAEAGSQRGTTCFKTTLAGSGQARPPPEIHSRVPGAHLQSSSDPRPTEMTPPLSMFPAFLQATPVPAYEASGDMRPRGPQSPPSASSSLPSLLLPCCPSFPGPLHLPSTSHQHGFRWAQFLSLVTQQPFVDHFLGGGGGEGSGCVCAWDSSLSPEDAP